MSAEQDQVFALANRLLDEPNCDPDDDLRVLSRQLLRMHEEAATLLTHATYSDFSPMGHDVWHERRRVFLRPTLTANAVEVKQP